MEDTKLMRLLIEQAKVSSVLTREKFEFLPIWPKDSGLPYYIYVDNGSCYKNYNHPLLLYVKDGRSWIAVTVSQQPKFISMVKNGTLYM